MALPLGQGDSMPSLDDCPQTTPPTPSRADGLPWNRWLLCVGITGWIQSECPAALRRNAQSRVRIPSPAPDFPREISFVERSFGAFFCFPAPGTKTGEAGGKQQKSGSSRHSATFGM